MMLRRAFVFACVLGVLTLAGGRGLHAEADQAQAKDMVTRLSHDAVDVMTNKAIADGDRIARFRSLFISAVDMPTVSRFILARHWKVATPDQQKDFMHLFEDMLVYTWATRFKDAADNISVSVTGVRPEGDDGAVVDSAILRPGQDPVPVVWRLRQVDGTPKIIDLQIEGTSMILTYREEYASVIGQSGGKIDGLLDVLRKKTVAMAAAQK